MFKRLQIILVLVVALLAPQAAFAGPPLFKVSQGGATLYLFGTFHALPDNSAQWLTPTLRRALDGAHTVVFEIDPATMEGPEAQAIALKRGLVFDDNTLDRRLPPDLFERVVKAAAEHGLPAAGMRQLQPWMAALTLTQLNVKKLGFSQDQGAEMQIYRALKTGRARVQGLETIEKQIGFFADLPVSQQVDMVRESLDETAESAKMLGAMKRAWLAGDEAQLEALLNNKLKTYPDLYDVLMRQRNRAWMAALQGLLRQQGAALVAVGTAHLVGEDSVVALLRQQGFAVERVDH